MSQIVWAQSQAPTPGNVASIAVTMALNPSSLLIVFAGTTDSTSTFTITDTASHTWNPLTAAEVGSVPDRCQSWWTITKKPFTVITVGKISPGGSLFTNVMVDEFLYVDTANPIASAAATHGSSVTPTVNVTPTRNRSMLWGACNDTLTAVGTGFTRGANDGSTDWTQWKLLGDGTAGGAQTVSFTGSGNWNIAAAAINPAPNSSRPRSLRPAPFKPGLGR